MIGKRREAQSEIGKLIEGNTVDNAGEVQSYKAQPEMISPSGKNVSFVGVGE